ncbi:MAG: hypothetical protein MR274_07560 [Clostridium sp.]|nr:hypothetical protein [Clostridium sp.]
MKKLLVSLLTITLLVSVSVTTFATDINQDSDPKRLNTSLGFVIDPTYTVTIPANVKLEKQTAPDGTITYEKDLTITANDVRLHQNTAISVSMEGDFKMDVTNASTVNLYQLPYQAFVGDNEITETNNLVAVFDTNTSEQSAVIHFTANNPEYAGDYSDTVTFIIANLY